MATNTPPNIQSSQYFEGENRDTTELDYEYIDMYQIPENISEFQNLQLLRLASCGLTDMSSATQLQSLTHLFLDGNNFNEIPESIDNLMNLQHLELSNCKISNVPESIGNLAQLTHLDIATIILKACLKVLKTCMS